MDIGFGDGSTSPPPSSWLGEYAMVELRICAAGVNLLTAAAAKERVWLQLAVSRLGSWAVCAVRRRFHAV